MTPGADKSNVKSTLKRNQFDWIKGDESRAAQEQQVEMFSRLRLRGWVFFGEKCRAYSAIFNMVRNVLSLIDSLLWDWHVLKVRGKQIEQWQ